MLIYDDIRFKLNNVKPKLDDLRLALDLDKAKTEIEELEKKAYDHVGGFRAPAQTVADFLDGMPSTGPGTVLPSYRPGVTWTDLHQILPGKITRALEEALPQMDRQLPGFASRDAVMTGPETRSSSPVRILRGENRQSELKGLYPAGEGAGYAGGIMSAAIDGMMAAEALLNSQEG